MRHLLWLHLLWLHVLWLTNYGCTYCGCTYCGYTYYGYTYCGCTYSGKWRHLLCRRRSRRWLATQPSCCPTSTARITSRAVGRCPTR